MKGQDRVKDDERILGDGEFVAALLAEANERLDRGYALKQKGYDFKTITEKVSKLYNVEETEIFSKGRRKVQVEARDLLCFWAVEELGISRTAVAKRLGMTQPGVGYAVNRGKKIVENRGYKLTK